MPLFDKSQATDNTSDQHLDMVNMLIDRMRARLVDKIELPVPPSGFRLPNMVRGYVQAHLRRIVMFIDGGHAEYLAGRPLMTEMASRAIYENVATLCDFTKKLKPLCDTLDYAGVDKLVTKAAFVTRIPSYIKQYGEHAKAPQILKHVDAMDKVYDGTYRNAYDYLSDIVHPNGLGAVVYFSSIEGDVMTFHARGLSPDRPISSLFLACMLLGTLEMELTEVENGLKKLIDGQPKETDGWRWSAKPPKEAR